MINEELTKAILGLYPVLSEVDRGLLTRVLSNATLITLKTGAPVFGELDPCNGFPFILSGNIRVYKQSAD